MNTSFRFVENGVKLWKLCIFQYWVQFVYSAILLFLNCINHILLSYFILIWVNMLLYVYFCIIIILKWSKQFSKVNGDSFVISRHRFGFLSNFFKSFSIFFKFNFFVLIFYFKYILSFKYFLSDVWIFPKLIEFISKF